MTRSNLTATEPTSIHSIQSQVSPWLKTIIHPLGQYLVVPTFFGKIQVFGRENVPRTGAVILAPTHRTRWDPILVPYAGGPYVTGRSSRFMVSADEMKGVQGWFVRRLGGFPVDTNKPGIASIRHSVELLHAGEMLTIFPEALRYLGELQAYLFGRVLVDPADLRMLIFGLALILVMLFRPAGLLPSARRQREFDSDPAVLAQEQSSLYDSTR